MSPGKRPSRNGSPPGRAANHTRAPIAASAAPAKTIILPSSRIDSTGFQFYLICQGLNYKRRRKVAGQFPVIPASSTGRLKILRVRIQQKPSGLDSANAKAGYYELWYLVLFKRIVGPRHPKGRKKESKDTWPRTTRLKTIGSILFSNNRIFSSPRRTIPSI